MVERGAPPSALRAEIAMIEARRATRGLEPADAARLERLVALEYTRKSRLPRQIAAAREKLSRLEAAYYG